MKGNIFQLFSFYSGTNVKCKINNVSHDSVHIKRQKIALTNLKKNIYGVTSKVNKFLEFAKLAILKPPRAVLLAI